MADDIQTQGGTQEQTQEQVGKTYSEAEINQLVEEKVKAAQTEAWKHWQSIADKAIKAVRSQSEAERAKLTAELEDYRKRQFEAMSPEEQQKVMLKEMYDRIKNGNGATAQPPSTPAPSGDTQRDEAVSGGQADIAAVRAEVSSVLKEYGVDPAKVDWAEDTSGMDALKRFLKSVSEQMKPGAGDTEDDARTEANRVDNSRSAGNVSDITKADPLDLIGSGYGKRIRGGLTS